MYFTLATAASVSVDGWRFSGSNYPANSGIDRPCLASSSPHGYFNLDKDGIYRYSLPYIYHSTSPTSQPMRFDLEAGTYFFEFVISAPSTSTFAATLSPKPTYTKTFTGAASSSMNGAPWRGIDTDFGLFPGGGSSASYLYWTPMNTATTFRITLNNGGSALFIMRYGATNAAGRAALVASGWVFDDKGYTYSKTLNGTTDLSIPVLNGSWESHIIVVQAYSGPFTAQILS